MGKVNLKFIKRILIYGTGLMCLAFGVVFSVNSGLGVSPINSLPYIVSMITGTELGNCVTIIFSLYILIQLFLLRKDFKWINLTQIFFSGLFGYFVEVAKWVVGDFSLPTYFGQLAMLGISVLFVSTGVCLYMNVKLVNMPMEGVTHAIAERFFRNIPFHDVKVIIDCLGVFLGITLSVIFLNRVEGIREGTVLCALLVGKIMKPMQKILIPAISRICF